MSDTETGVIPDIVKKWMFGDFCLRDDVAEVVEKYFKEIKEGFTASVLRRCAWALVALSAYRGNSGAKEIAEAEGNGKFIYPEELSLIEPGDSYEVDYLLMSLLDAGFDAGYATIISTKSFNVSVFFIGMEELGIVSQKGDDSIVEEWDGSMCEVPEAD